MFSYAVPFQQKMTNSLHHETEKHWESIPMTIWWKHRRLGNGNFGTTARKVDLVDYKIHHENRQFRHPLPKAMDCYGFGKARGCQMLSSGRLSWSARCFETLEFAISGCSHHTVRGPMWIFLCILAAFAGSMTKHVELRLSEKWMMTTDSERYPSDTILEWKKTCNHNCP